MSIYGSSYGRSYGSIYGSVGPFVELVFVPNLTGMAVSDATNLVTLLGFEFAYTTGYSSTVAPGLVVSQKPFPGTPAPLGSTVAVVFSIGPKPYVRPGYWAARRQRSERVV